METVVIEKSVLDYFIIIGVFFIQTFFMGMLIYLKRKKRTIADSKIVSFGSVIAVVVYYILISQSNNLEINEFSIASLVNGVVINQFFVLLYIFTWIRDYFKDKNAPKVVTQIGVVLFTILPVGLYGIYLLNFVFSWVNV
ncbi:hypothetical protein ACQUY5_26845 [Bacillus cereus]|uniref:hypothetical protein n=1 Tax=Bacillus cereus TaxID=1396 RepID=UPI003D170180